VTNHCHLIVQQTRVLAVDQPMVEVDRTTGACRYSELTVTDIIGDAAR
jgi:hypothetical protein